MEGGGELDQTEYTFTLLHSDNWCASHCVLKIKTEIIGFYNL